MEKITSKLDFDLMKHRYEEQIREVSANIDYAGFMTGYAAGYIDGIRHASYLVENYKIDSNINYNEEDLL